MATTPRLKPRIIAAAGTALRVYSVQYDPQGGGGVPYYVELVAATTEPILVVATYTAYSNVLDGGAGTWRFATGGAGSESVFFETGEITVSSAISMTLPIPIRIASGSRISARTSNTGGPGRTVTQALYYVREGDVR